MKYVLGFAFNEDKSQVLLIKKNRPNWQAGLYNGIGGKIEHYDLNSIAALVREFREETGLETSNSQWTEYAIIESETFHVTCFWSILENFNDYQSITDEKIVAISIKDLFNSQFDCCLSNLSWLICMALEKHNTNIFSRIIYS